VDLAWFVSWQWWDRRRVVSWHWSNRLVLL